LAAAFARPAERETVAQYIDERLVGKGARGGWFELCALAPTCSRQPRVRTRLAAGGKRIRTAGPTYA
jgi:hypothetical protein